jgi:hypothetical protein
MFMWLGYLFGLFLAWVVLMKETMDMNSLLVFGTLRRMDKVLHDV